MARWVAAAVALYPRVQAEILRVSLRALTKIDSESMMITVPTPFVPLETPIAHDVLFSAPDVMDAAVINDISVMDLGAVPEPSEVCLLGMGLAMLAVVLRHRRVANR